MSVYKSSINFKKKGNKSVDEEAIYKRLVGGSTVKPTQGPKTYNQFIENKVTQPKPFQGPKTLNQTMGFDADKYFRERKKTELSYEAINKTKTFEGNLLGKMRSNLKAYANINQNTDLANDRNYIRLADRLKIQEQKVALTDNRDKELKKSLDDMQLDFNRMKYNSVINLPDYKSLAQKGKAESKPYNMVSDFEDFENGVTEEHNNANSYIGYMTPQEKETYQYYFANGGRKEAEKYYKFMEEELSLRGAEKFTQDVNNIENDALRGVTKGAMSFGAGVGSAVTGMKQTGKTLTGNLGWTDKQLVTPSPMEYSQQTLRQDMGEVEGFINDVLFTGGNMAPSIAMGGAGKGVASAIMGSGIFGNSYAGAVRNGATEKEALAYGLASATTEMATQYLLGGIKGMSKGGLSTVLPKIDTALSKYITNPKVLNAIAKTADVAGKSFDEALEEYVQANIEPVLGNVILGQDNKIQPFSSDKLYSALIGGVMGGGTNVFTAQGNPQAQQKIDDNKRVKNIDSEYTKTADKLLGSKDTSHIKNEPTQYEKNLKKSNEEVAKITSDKKTTEESISNLNKKRKEVKEQLKRTLGNKKRAELTDTYNNLTVKRQSLIDTLPSFDTAIEKAKRTEFVPEESKKNNTIQDGEVDNNIQGEIPNTLSKASTRAYDTDNNYIDFTYKVVPLNELIVSNNSDGTINEKYPKELQPRDRQRVNSIMQINNIAKNLNPALLGESANVSDGAPIIGDDNVVESGNGRVAGIQLAMQGKTEKYKDYIEYVKSNAQKFGIDPSSIKDGDVLVRVRNTNVDRASFTKKANESTVSGFSATEVSKQDASKLDSDILSLFASNDNGDLTTKENKAFVGRFIDSVVPSNEKGRYITASGDLTQDGLTRVRNAIFERAYKNQELSTKLSESLDDETKNVTRALVNTAPRAISIEESIKNGDLYELNFSQDVSDGAKLYNDLKGNNKNIEEFISQESFVDEYSNEAKAIAYVFDKTKRSSKSMSDFLNIVYNQVEMLGNPNQQTFAGDLSKTTKGDILNAAEKIFNEQREDSGKEPVSLPKLRPKESKPVSRIVQQNVSEKKSESVTPNPKLVPKRGYSVSEAKTIKTQLDSIKTKDIQEFEKTAVAPGKYTPQQKNESRLGPKENNNLGIVNQDLNEASNVVKDVARTAYQNVVSSTSPLERMSKKNLNPNIEVAVQMARQSGGVVDVIAEQSLVSKDGKKVDISYKQLMDKIPKGKIKEFNDYALNLHNVDRMSLVEKAKAKLDDYVINNNFLKKLSYSQIQELASANTQNSQAVKEYLRLHDIISNTHNKPVFGEDITIYNDDGSSKTQKIYRTAKESQTIVDEFIKVNPEFKKITEDINNWWDKFSKEWLVDSGIVTQESYNLMRELYPNYVPTNRVNKGHFGNGIFGRSVSTPKVVKVAEGGISEVLPIEETFMANINRTVKAARRNELGNEILKFATDNPKDAALLGVKLSEDTDITDNITDIIDDVDNETLKQLKNGDYQLIVSQDGNKVSLDISKDVWESLRWLQDNGFSESWASNIVKVGQSITKPVKSAITGVNALFAVTNAARDISSYMMNTVENNPFKAVSSYGKAFYELAMDKVNSSNTKGDSDLSIYRGLGGDRTGWYSVQKGYKDSINPKFNELSNGEKIVKVATTPITAPFKLFGAVGEFTEQIPRLAEFKNAIDKYGTSAEGLKKASAAAADVTVNFSRNAPVGKAFDAWTLYLNAQIQGLDKTARQIKNHPNGTAIKGAVYVLLPTILLHLLNDENPYYDEINNRTKDTYFLIPNITDTDSKGNAKTFFKLPKSREYGALLSASFDRAMQAFETKDIKESFRGYGNTLSTSFLPTEVTTNNILSPILVNLKSNKDFADRDIVPQSMKDLEPKYQYDVNTSGIAKNIGEKFNFSPKQIDYIIDSYAGYPGDIVQALTSQLNKADTLEETLINAVSRATVEPFKRRFTADPLFSSAVVDKFYNEIDKTATEKATRKHVENIPDGAVTPEAKKLSYLTKISGQMADLRKEEKNVLGQSISTKEKEAKIKNIRTQINELARNAVLDANKIYSDYSKNYVMEISHLSDEKQDIARSANKKGLSYSDFLDYNNKISQKGTKKYEKMAYLKNLSSSPQVKRELYINMIADGEESKEVKKMNEALSQNLSFDKYLSTYSEYLKINEKDISATEKATEFNKYIDRQLSTKQQKNVISDLFKYWNMFPATPKAYNERTLSEKDAEIWNTPGIKEITGDVKTFIELQELLEPLQTDKDRNGKSISGTLKANRYKALRENGLSDYDSRYLLNKLYGYK